MKDDQISYEIKHMSINKNKEIIEHIYLNATEKMPRRNEHPLDLICKSIQQAYSLKIETVLVNRSKALVTLSFDESHDSEKIRQVERRFHNTTEILLDAELIKVTERPH